MVRRIAALALLAALTLSTAAADDRPRLLFTAAPSPEHDAAVRLMVAEAGFDIDPAFIEIAKIDLDLDGEPELFAFADASYFCGSAGCVPRIYKRDGDGWKELDIGLDDFINGVPEMWSVGPVKVNGHLVLVLTEPEFTTSFAWDGSAYVAEN